MKTFAAWKSKVRDSKVEARKVTSKYADDFQWTAKLF